MDVVLHETAADFWQAAETLYAADPVRHTMALTVVPPLIEARHEAQDYSPQPLLLTIVERGAVIGAAFRTPPLPIGVSGIPAAAAPAVVDFLVDHLPDKGGEICGASGPREQVNEFAANWAARTGDTVVESMAQRLYGLNSLAKPDVAGECRLATGADVPLLGAWRRTFANEAHLGADDPEWPVAALRRSLAGQNPHVIWNVDGVPVAYAAGNRPVHGMSRVGPVYDAVECRSERQTPIP